MIISLSGKAKSGKDTVGEYLVKKHGFIQMSWAENLKAMCRKVFSLSQEQTDTQKGKETPLEYEVTLNYKAIEVISGWMMATSSYDPFRNPDHARKYLKFLKDVNLWTAKTPREILQKVGTEVCRSLHESYHVDVLASRINGSNKNIVITDTRFPDELIAARSLSKDSKLIQIVRPGIEINQSSHASETSLDACSSFDHVLENTSTLEDLYDKLEDILNPLAKCPF